jgi:hypothetical protein
MRDPEDVALVREILPALEVDHQYTRLVEGWNQNLLALIRRRGRQSGKRLGYDLRTLTSALHCETVSLTVFPAVLISRFLLLTSGRRR